MSTYENISRTGARHRLALFIGGLGAAAILLFGGTAAAVADESPTLVAAPNSIAVGDSATVTASGLGGLETAVFGLNATPGGEFVESAGTTYSAPVSAGSATATFTATAAGVFTIAVGDGETPLATATITVTAADPSPAASATAVPSTITVGQTSTITGTDLGDLETAVFGIDATAGGSLAGGSTSATVAVANGTASTTFGADRAGTFTIAVSDGESVLATTVVTVVAAASPTPTPTPSPLPGPSAGTSVWLWILLGLLGAAAVAILVVVVARRRTHKADADQASPNE